MYFPVPSLLTEFLILAIVEKKASYGYEISQTVKLVADIKESTLYPILKKLEKSGYLSTYSEEHQGRKRKYYTITSSGHAQLDFLKTEWSNYSHTITDIIEGRLRHEKD
ncbi:MULTISPECIES: PadR family transcriptional regulator [Streptococcus]|uniref:PadR family transcriptional regulator PadR n=1 Tax=Streptococcus porcorum TaxID=701526 RepID=A0ABV2JCP2_9STRE|nr:PadR family transcriptional regulator [Streptococcus sp.]MDY3824788.1 PadR family transcriptional regulator [Streptococcus sp.]